jgi:hypothetical protein
MKMNYIVTRHKEVSMATHHVPTIYQSVNHQLQTHILFHYAQHDNQDFGMKAMNYDNIYWEKDGDRL